MKAKITNLNTWKSYIVSCEKDCKDATDKSAYRASEMLNTVITMGKVIVEPIK